MSYQCARIYVERMQELTEDVVCYHFAKSKMKRTSEGIPANSRDVNRSTRRKNSGREQYPAYCQRTLFLYQSSHGFVDLLRIVDLFRHRRVFERPAYERYDLARPCYRYVSVARKAVESTLMFGHTALFLIK